MIYNKCYFPESHASHGFSLFSADTSSTVPVYADENVSAKCNFLFYSLPACQKVVSPQRKSHSERKIDLV